MKHVRLVMTTSLLLTLLSGRPATAKGADWIGWLEQLSGPGPFLDDNSKKPAGFTFTVCRTDDVHKENTDKGDFRVRLQNWVIGTPPRQGQKACIYGERQFFVAPAEGFQVSGTDTRFVTGRGFPRVTATLWETGLSYSVAPMLDVGAGGGRIFFNVANGASEGRWTVTPLRIAFKPVMLLPWVRKYKAAGILKFVLKETYLFGDLNGDDFGAPTTAQTPASAYSTKTDLARSFSLNVDLTEAVCATRGLQADFSWTRWLGDCGGPRSDTLTVFVRNVDKNSIDDATVCFFPVVGSVFSGTTSEDGIVRLPTPEHQVTVVTGKTRTVRKARKPQFTDSVVVVSHPEYEQATFLVSEETRRLDVRLKKADMPQRVAPCSEITVQ